MTDSKSRELSLIRALVHGDSGVGKTTSLATLPEDKTLIITAERGVLPLRKHNYRVIQIESWDDLREIMAWLLKPEKCTDDAMREFITKSLRIIAADSLSEFAGLCIKHIVEVDRKRLISGRTGGKSESPKDIYEDQMTMEDWGLYRTRILSLIATCCHLPYHVVMTCLSAWTEDKVTGAQMRTPNLSGKAATECAAYFDLVLHMESADEPDGTNRRVWRTYNDGRVIAKDASGVLAPLEETNWSAVFKKILTVGEDKKPAGKPKAQPKQETANVS